MPLTVAGQRRIRTVFRIGTRPGVSTSAVCAPPFGSSAAQGLNGQGSTKKPAGLTGLRACGGTSRGALDGRGARGPTAPPSKATETRPACRPHRRQVFWLTGCLLLALLAPGGDNGCASFVPDYSNGAAPDSHRLPSWPPGALQRAGGTCGVQYSKSLVLGEQSSAAPGPCKAQNRQTAIMPGPGAPGLDFLIGPLSVP